MSALRVPIFDSQGRPYAVRLIPQGEARARVSGSPTITGGIVIGRSGDRETRVTRSPAQVARSNAKRATTRAGRAR